MKKCYVYITLGFVQALTFQLMFFILNTRIAVKKFNVYNRKILEINEANIIFKIFGIQK